MNHKARFVIEGYRDRMKHMMLHSSQNINYSTLLMELTLATMHDLKVGTSDVFKAYLQSDKPMESELLVKDLAP